MKRLLGKIIFLLKDPQVVRLLLYLGFAAAFIITINYYTIKILSSARAYINGESYYSRGEKDASQNLILLLETKDIRYWDAFKANIAIPKGDSIARENMLLVGEINTVRSGFLQGGNHPDDIDNMIWLFQNFHILNFMMIPINIWKQGDSLIYQKIKIGYHVKNLVESGLQSDSIKNELLHQILINSNELTTKERAFSDHLGVISRRIGRSLLIFNIVVVTSIFAIAILFASKTLNKLKERNLELSNTNTELDKFVYSASHDLRAPITSLKGLVAITKMESDPVQIQSYLELMDQTLEKQDQFIKDIIDYSLNKKHDIKLQSVNLTSLINEAIEEHLYMPGAKEIKISTNLAANEILSDPKRLSIVVNNLVSNAFKYQDHTKKEKTLSIKSSLKEGMAIIELEDNGIGIPPKHLKHIFEMFYVVNTGSKGSGLGLYITKETVSKLGGDIFVSSKINFGTKFTIRLPQSV